MPVLNKPSTNEAQVRQPTQVVNLGGFLAGAVPVTSLKETWAKVCVYGRNRSGKTTLACMFPKPLLLVSFEPDECGGATSVSASSIDGVSMEGVTIVRVWYKPLPINGPCLQSPTKFHRFINDSSLCKHCERIMSFEKVYGTNKAIGIAEQLKTSNPFKTVVVDTVTSLQDIALVESAGLTKIPEMLSFGGFPEFTYQRRAELTRIVMHQFLEISNCHIVMLAQEKDHNAPQDRGKHKYTETMQQGSFMGPSLGDTTAAWLRDNCGYTVQIYEDEVIEYKDNPNAGKLEIHTGRRARHLRLLYHANFAGGGRWEYNPNTPEFVTADSPRKLYLAMAKYAPTLGV